jgi:putative phage-type endonuclease
MAIVDLVQRTEKWLDWRKEGITASMIPVIMGLSPYQTAYELWAELTGLKTPADLSNNWHVQRGVEQEPEARATIENELGKPFIPVCVEADHNKRFKASLDGLFMSNEATEVLEVKCPCEKIYRSIGELKGKSDNFQMYAAQVQWQLNCSGAQKGYLYFYLRGERPINATIRRNQGFIDNAESKALAFWDLVQRKTPPARVERDTVVYELQNSVDNAETSTSMWDKNVTAYKAVNRKMKALETQSKALKEEVKVIEDYFKAKIPDDAVTFDKDGIRATKCERTGAIDNDAFLVALSEKTGQPFTDLVDLQETHRASATSYYRIAVSHRSKVQKQQSAKIVVNERKDKRNATPIKTVMNKTIAPKAGVDVTPHEPIKPLSAAAFFKGKAGKSMFF